MSMVTLTAKGQTTIPKDVREYLGIRPHDKLIFTPANGKVLMTPLRGTIRGLRGMFPLPAWQKRPLNFRKLRRAYEQEQAAHAVQEMR